MPDFSLNQIVEMLRQGGWVMAPLFALAVYICFIATDLLLHFNRSEHRKVAQETWTAWVQEPEKCRGEVGEIIRYTQDQAQSIEEVHTRFTEVLAAHLPGVDRRLRFLNVLVMAAPLMGLLGTVLGMLETFQALSRESSRVMDMISSGISEALITTEMGLLIALPGYLAVYMIKRRRNEYEAFLARIESAVTQQFQKNMAAGLAKTS